MKKKIKSLKHKIKLPYGSISQELLDFYCIGILSVLLEKVFLILTVLITSITL